LSISEEEMSLNDITLFCLVSAAWSWKDGQKIAIQKTSANSVAVILLGIKYPLIIMEQNLAD
jgi:hypothetical protein